MEFRASRYLIGKPVPVEGASLTSFSRPGNADFLWASFKGFSMYVFGNGMIRVVYFQPPSDVVTTEAFTITRLIEQLNSRFGYSIKAEDVISSKTSDEGGFSFEPDSRLTDASLPLAAFLCSNQLNGEFKTQRLFEMVGSLLGESLVRDNEPSTLPELFSLLSAYTSRAGLGTMEVCSIDRAGADAGSYSLSFSGVPFEGRSQGHAYSILLQNLVKSAYIRFVEQLNVYVTVIKSWERGDDRLVLEIGLRNL